MVVPKLEVDKLLDAPDEYLQQLLLFARPIARAVEASFPCNRVGLAVIGLEVPHAHLHLVPINSADDLNFTRPKLKLSNEQLAAVQQAILTHLKA